MAVPTPSPSSDVCSTKELCSGSERAWNRHAGRLRFGDHRLAADHFYDNLIFHRIIPQFVIQGGCPDGTGTGGPGWQVNAEFNDRQHVEGTLSMARSGHPDSAGSQFFVCLGREHCQHLDNQYTGFGQVIEGMDVVRAIGAVETDGQARPLEPVSMTSVELVTPTES